jgi:hypothetical protein
VGVETNVSGTSVTFFRVKVILGDDFVGNENYLEKNAVCDEPLKFVASI